MPPLKYFIPNSFTALSLLLGLASVTLSAKGAFELAAWMILWGTLLDKADGTAARLFKATSEFGVQFDSFADFVAFGVAPAALLYYRVLATGRFEVWQQHALMGAAGLYVLALAIRLARFNITTVAGESVFQGLPGTLLGALLASGYLTWDKYGLDEGLLLMAPTVLVVGALLMVSSVPLPKLKVRKSKALNVFQIGNVVVAYIVGPLMMFPEYLLGLALTYSVVGVVYCQLFPPSPEDGQGDGGGDTEEAPAPVAQG